MNAHGARAGRWLGVVLCGGASRRMGQDKARLVIDGAPLYARVAGVLAEVCDEVVLASGPVARFADRRWREVADAAPGTHDHGHQDQREGPLAALVAGLALASKGGFDGIVTAPCDAPRLAAAALRPLQRAVAPDAGGTDTSVDVAHWRRGEHHEPLCAALSVHALPTLQAAFRRGVRRPTEAFAELRGAIREAPAALADALTNVNTPDELARVEGRDTRAERAHPQRLDRANKHDMGRAEMGDVT